MGTSLSLLYFHPKSSVHSACRPSIAGRPGGTLSSRERCASVRAAVYDAAIQLSPASIASRRPPARRDALLTRLSDTVSAAGRHRGPLRLPRAALSAAAPAAAGNVGHTVYTVRGRQPPAIGKWFKTTAMGLGLLPLAEPLQSPGCP